VTEWFALRPDRAGQFTDPDTGRRIGLYRSPFARTPNAARVLVEALLEREPRLTVAELVERVHFDPELRDALSRYVSDGFGHLKAVGVIA
jgi:hypothetical protein